MDGIWWAFLKLLIALPIVLIITIVVLRYGIKGYQCWNGSGQGMKVVDSMALNSRTSVYVLDIQGTFYLIGSQEGQLVLLDKLEYYHTPEPARDGAGDFDALFKNRLRQISHRVTDKFKKDNGRNDGQD